MMKAEDCSVSLSHTCSTNRKAFRPTFYQLSISFLYPTSWFLLQNCSGQVGSKGKVLYAWTETRKRKCVMILNIDKCLTVRGRTSARRWQNILLPDCSGGKMDCFIMKKDCGRGLPHFALYKCENPTSNPHFLGDSPTDTTLLLPSTVAITGKSLKYIEFHL